MNAEFWFLLGLVLIVLEVVMGFTIVLLFTSLAAFTVGFIMYWKFMVFEGIYWQFAAFFALTVIWALILWKPLKRLKERNSKHGNVQNFVGQSVEVIDADLTKINPGNAKWSGTIVKAIIHPDFREEKLPVGTIAKIVDVRDNVFVVII
jgi:inner membrane protein